MNMKNRREMVKASAAFMGVLGAFGLLGGNARGQRLGTSTISTSTDTLKLIVEEAMVTKDMGAVLTKYERRITPQQKEALSKLTAQDLNALVSIKEKLAAFDVNMGANVGSIIY
jgi:hypothetical protein